MIFVNLLPPEFVKRKISIPKPVKIGGWALLGIVISFGVLGNVRRGTLERELRQLRSERQALSGDLANSEKLLVEMNQTILPKKSFLDKFESPDAQWDQILNLLSDVLPDDLWLTMVRLDDEDRVWLRVEGYAKPSKQRVEMQSIGEFVVAAKKQLESFIGQFDPEKGQQLSVQTSTEQQQWESVPVTQFRIEFRKGGEL